MESKLLSPDYFVALGSAARHHLESKTYSGKLMRPHVPFIKEIIDRLKIKSILDYGCGKGRQYEWVMPEFKMTVEQYWGMSVAKYDPAYAPFAEFPKGKFDLVICTHVLGSIPTKDLTSIVDEIYGFAKKAIYVAEKIGEVNKKVFEMQTAMPRGWLRGDWARVLMRESKVEVTLSTRLPTPDGVLTTREILR